MRLIEMELAKIIAVNINNNIYIYTHIDIGAVSAK